MKSLFLLWFLLGLSAGAAEMLVESGKSAYVIVLSPRAVPAEKTAAKELQSFLKRISGAELPIVEQASGPAVYVGQSPETARALGILSWDRLAPDEIILRTSGKNLYLAGDRPRGTLYAVYELLEKKFGVRFWTPSAAKIPKSASLKLPEINLRYAPPFEVRSVGCILMRQNPVFAVRSRNNGQGVTIPEEWGGQVVPLGNVHTFFQFAENALIPVDRYFASHPEWYSERDGKRISDGQLCLSNRKLRKELCRQVLKRLDASPGARFISVSQNDNEKYCECGNCRAFVRKYGNQSDLLLSAVNEVAAAVAKKYPRVYVETLAYQYTRVPPQRVKAAGNVVIRYCTFEADFFRTLKEKQNRVLYSNLAGWSRTAKHLMIWNYIINFHKYYLPFPNWHTIGPDLRVFRGFKTISMYEQGAWNGGGPIADLWELRSWLTARLLWNPDLDSNALIDEFLNGFYGPGAPAVRRYLELMRNSQLRHPKASGYGFADSTENWLDEKNLLEAWQIMESACRRFKNDPVCGPRLSAASVPVNCAFLERRKPLKAWKITDPELRKLKAAEQVAEIVARMNAAGAVRVREGDKDSRPEDWGRNLIAALPEE